MESKGTPLLEGVQLTFPLCHADERGSFFESYRSSQWPARFVQDNVAFSKKGVLRGLHYQRSPGQAKLVSALLGTIFDVVVDLRRESPTFGKWESFILDEETRGQLFIPVGFAHGYCVLSETALVTYKVSASYDPAEEKSIRWNDPDLNIQWPIQEPLLSLRDQQSPLFKEVFSW